MTKANEMAPTVSHSDMALTTSMDQAIEIDENSHLTLIEAIRKWRKVFWVTLSVSWIIVIYGYDNVIVGNCSAMPAFQLDFGQLLDGRLIIPSLWLGLWTFVAPAGGMIGSIFAGYFQDWYGRKCSFAVGAIVSIISTAICFASQYPSGPDSRRGTFLAGKGVSGIAIGIIMTTCQTYMSETIPPKIRGPLFAFIPLFTFAGQLVGSLVIFGLVKVHKGYAIAFATQWPISVIALVVSIFIPESPTYLVRKGSMDKALAAQRRLAGQDVPPERTLAIIKRDIERERCQSKATLVASFRGYNLRRTMIVLFASIMPQAFGLTLLAQGSYFGQVLGMPAKLSLALLIAGIGVGLCANTFSMWIMSRYGHRLLVLVGLCSVGFLWFTMGVASIWHNMTVTWYCTAILLVVTAIAGLTVWPASYAIGSEVSALNMRAKAQGLGWLFSNAVSAAFGLALPYIYNPDAGNLRGKIGFIFAALCAIGSLITYLSVPEMKGRTPSEIDRMFELGLAARDFSMWTFNETEGTEKQGSRNDTVAIEV